MVLSVKLRYLLGPLWVVSVCGGAGEKGLPWDWEGTHHGRSCSWLSLGK